jgi:hypothetical protein
MTIDNRPDARCVGDGRRRRTERMHMKLTVVLVNTYRTRIAVQFENDHIPYSRRIVQIPLSKEQEVLLAPRKLGRECGKDVYEEYGSVWLEEDEREEPDDDDST